MISAVPLVNEQWLPVSGAEGFYCVSSAGRIRSEPLPYKCSGRQRGRVLSPSLDTKGYPIVCLCIPGKPSRTVKVHRLVAAAFLGEPEGRQVNHLNGIKTDNRVQNLEYVSCLENIRHCWKHGLHGADHCRGEANPFAKLTAAGVLAIRARRNKETAKSLAQEFGVSTTTISLIVNRRVWKHV